VDRLGMGRDLDGRVLVDMLGMGRDKDGKSAPGWPSEVSGVFRRLGPRRQGTERHGYSFVAVLCLACVGTKCESSLSGLRCYKSKRRRSGGKRKCVQQQTSEGVVPRRVPTFTTPSQMTHNLILLN